MFKEYPHFDGIGLADLLRNKEVSLAEVLEAAIHQIEKYNPQLNAVVYKMYESAHQESLDASFLERPFAGLPFLVKDLEFEIKGTPTTGASLLTKDYLAQEDSEIIQRYRRAGLIPIGKSNTSEFGILGATDSDLWGPCRNPWNPELNSGGSSGGSAAAVAIRMVPLASGDDSGGSLRIPASACGVFGFKPSRGFQVMGPKKGEGWLGLMSHHVISRSVRDSAMVFQYTQGPGIGAPYGPTRGSLNLSLSTLNSSVKGLKVAFSKQSLLGEYTHPDCLLALERTLKCCEDLGMEIIEDQPALNQEELIVSYFIIVAASVAGELARIEKLTGRKADTSTTEGPTLFLKIAGEKLRASDLEKALHVSRLATIQWEKFLSSYDFFCTPTMAHPHVPMSAIQTNTFEKRVVRLAEWLPLNVIMKTVREVGRRGVEKTPNTSIFNMTGHPAMSVPSYWNAEGLPIGVQFIGKMGADETLFSLASALEISLRWGEKLPSLFSI